MKLAKAAEAKAVEATTGGESDGYGQPAPPSYDQASAAEASVKAKNGTERSEEQSAFAAVEKLKMVDLNQKKIVEKVAE